MKSRTLSFSLKVIILGAAVCGLLLYFWFLPCEGTALAQAYPEFSYCYYPWLIFLWISGIPCYAVLLDGWRITSDIGKGAAFTSKNARRLSRISILTLCDCAFFFIVNIVFLFLNMNHPGILLGSLLICFVGLAFAICSGILSVMTAKAAVLQEQSDLTI